MPIKKSSSYQALQSHITPKLYYFVKLICVSILMVSDVINRFIISGSPPGDLLLYGHPSSVLLLLLIHHRKPLLQHHLPFPHSVISAGLLLPQYESACCSLSCSSSVCWLVPSSPSPSSPLQNFLRSLCNAPINCLAKSANTI